MEHKLIKIGGLLQAFANVNLKISICVRFLPQVKINLSKHANKHN